MERIIVDSDRDVIVPSELKKAIVQHDHNIIDIIIECPRYWYEGKKDISDCVFFINVLTEKTIKGKDPIAIPCTNKHVKEDDEYTMEMTWTITRDVSKHEGGFAFLVCAKKTDEEGNEDLHWNSHLCKEMVVSEGLEANLQEIESEYPDIITYILQELEDIKKNGTGGTTDAVQYVEQTLTEEQKTQARINIGAATITYNADTKTMNISSGGG